jgi:hypothetical protein
MVKTYLRLKYRSKGTKPSEIYKLLIEKKFTPTIGEYDFVYDWNNADEVKVDEILKVLDTVYDALNSVDVDYEVTTTEPLFHLHECPMLVKRAENKPAPKSDSKEASDSKTCPTCKQPAKFVSEYNRWYCHTCKKYV